MTKFLFHFWEGSEIWEIEWYVLLLSVTKIMIIIF